MDGAEDALAPSSFSMKSLYISPRATVPTEPITQRAFGRLQ
jgi:hypothetical protein